MLQLLRILIILNLYFSAIGCALRASINCIVFRLPYTWSTENMLFGICKKVYLRRSYHIYKALRSKIR